MNPKCSCPECDSLDCFVTRNTKVPCSCVKCKKSEACVYYSNKVNMNEIHSEFNMLWKTKAITNSTEKNECIEKEVIYNLKKNGKSGSITNIRSKYSYTPCGCKSDFNLKSERDERSHTNIHGVCMKFSRINFNSATADLSAQVMDVPYKDFKNCLSVNRSGNVNNPKMSKHDVLKIIKQAYKACSCKVCECISGKSHTRNELCKCKPCNCNDCASFLSKSYSVNDSVYLPMDGCPCVRCTRTQCKGIVNKYDEPQICDCKPPDCIKRRDSSNKLCKCQPCQCVECNMMSVYLPTTFIVAPVEEDYQGNVCQCAPCDCIECSHGYGIPSNLVHKISTEINNRSIYHCDVCINEACEPGGNNSCKYQRHSKIVTRLVQKDAHDYDIRTILTNKYRWRKDDKKFTSESNNDTVAMFATLPEQYRTKYDNINKSTDCDYLADKYDENAVNSIRSSQILKPTIFPYLKSDSCKYTQCECQVYSNEFIYKENMCECLNCESLTKNCICKNCSSVKLINKLSTKRICKNKSSLYVLCSKLIYTPEDVLGKHCENEMPLSYSRDDIYPIKRAKLLTPSILNGIECENMYSNSESYSTNLDDLLKISELNLQMNVHNDSFNSTQIKNEIPLNELCENNVGNNEALYDRTQTVDKRLTNDTSTFNSDVINNSYIYNNKNINKSNINENKYNNLYVTLYNDVNANIINNAYSKGIVNDLYLDSSIRKGTIYKLSELNDDTVKNRSRSIILSDSQFNLHADRYDEAKHIFNSSFKNEALSMIGERQLEDAYTKENDTDLLNLHVNYERAQKTLRKAKIYSSYLLKILDRYEKANTEFQSISQKLMLSDVSNGVAFTSIPLSESNIKNNDQVVVANKTGYAIEEDGIRNTNNPKNFRLALAKEMHINTTIKGTELESVKMENEEDLNSPTKGIINQDIQSQKTVNSDLNHVLKQQILNVTPKNIESNSCNDSAIFKCLPNYMYTNLHRKAHRRVTCYKIKYSKLLRRAIILSKKINLARKTKIITKVGASSEVVKHTSQILNSFKNVIDEKDNISLNTPINDNVQGIEDCNDSENINLTDIASIKKCGSESYVNAEERRTVENLKVQTSKEIGDQCTKSSCDALKVTFISLRRVSDHTVLVKWNVPINTANIEGYELQVDGRAVQKILSPTRNVAVVTCLPHNDKVLLTIRTITSAMIHADHYPSVTVIYHPRKK